MSRSRAQGQLAESPGRQSARVRFDLRAGVLASILLAMVPLLVLSRGQADENRDRQEASASRETRGLVDAAAAHHTSVLEGAEQLLGLVARLHEVLDGNPEECGRALEALLGRGSALTSVGVADPQGRVWCSASPAARNVTVADRPHFQRVIATKDFSVGGYVVGRLSGQPTLGLGQPVLDASGDLQGVIVAGLGLPWLTPHGSEYLMPEGSVIDVVDSRGIVLARFPPGEGYVGQRMLGNGTVVDRIRGHTNGSVVAPGFDGVERYYAYETLATDEAGGIVLVAAGIPLSAIQGPARSAFREAFIVTTVTGGGAFLLAWVGTEYLIGRPMRALTRAVRRIERGDYTARTRIHRIPQDIALLDRQLDQMAQAVGRLDHARRDFINNTSHELQTPLTVVKIQARLLRQRAHELTDPALVASVNLLERGVERLATTVTGVIAVADFESSPVLREVAETDLQALASRTIEGYRPRFQDAGIRLTSNLEPVGRLWLGEESIQRALGHLLENALEFTPAGGWVSVALGRHGHAVRLVVEDSGVGFDPADEGRLFQPFGRLSRDDVPAPAERGLGLFFVREAIVRHGGHVFAHSPGRGRGARIGFELPL